jgi:hypothetical protein
MGEEGVGGGEGEREDEEEDEEEGEGRGRMRRACRRKRRGRRGRGGRRARRRTANRRMISHPSLMSRMPKNDENTAPGCTRRKLTRIVMARARTRAKTTTTTSGTQHEELASTWVGQEHTASRRSGMSVGRHVRVAPPTVASGPIHASTTSIVCSDAAWRA